MHQNQPQQQPQRSTLSRFRNAAYFLALLALTVAGVTVYVLLERLSNEILTIIATIGCAAGVAMPGLLLSMIVLLKRTENNHRQEMRQQPQQQMQPRMTQPMITVTPAMMLPQSPTMMQPQQQQPATWETVQTPRHFTVVGGGEEAEW